MLIFEQCGDTEICEKGICVSVEVTPILPGTCEGITVNLNTDHSNCGGCGKQVSPRLSGRHLNSMSNNKLVSFGPRMLGRNLYGFHELPE